MPPLHQSENEQNERHATWIASQLKVFAAEGDIPQLEDGDPDTHTAAELAKWLEHNPANAPSEGQDGRRPLKNDSVACIGAKNGHPAPDTDSVTGGSQPIPAKARWLADQRHALRAHGLVPDMDAADRMAVFLRIADLELRKGDDGQDIEDSEVRRVAFEVSKLHSAGHFPNLAEAGLLTALFHSFKATLLETQPAQPPGSQHQPLTEAQKVEIPNGLRGTALRDFLQHDLEQAFGKDWIVS